MKRLAVLAAVLALAGPAFGQVRQTGTVTNGHAAMWTTNGVIQDAGTAASGLLTSLGITNNGGPGICVNSAAITGPYNQLCLSVSTAAAAQISLQNFGGATAQAMKFVINGTDVTLPSTPGSTFVTATGPFTANDVACFQNSAGALFDCGLTIVSGTVTAGTWNGSIIPLAFGGCGAGTAAGCRSNLGLGSMATQAASGVAITGGSITGMSSPTVSSDVATKGYVDATSTGLTILGPSRLATAAVLPNSPTYSNGASGVGATLTAGSNTTLTTDGTVAALNDVVLVKNQASAFQNGQYYVSTAGSGAAAWVLTRCTAAACGHKFDTAGTMVAGSYTFITAGATNASSAWVLSSTVGTVGTDAASFFQFSAAATTTSIDGQTGALTTGNGLTMVGTVLTATGSGSGSGLRLTLTSGTPVTTATVSGATTVYCTPYNGQNVPIYNGATFVSTNTGGQLSQATTDSTKSPAPVTINSNYDIFVWNDSGTIRCTRGPAWSTSLARGTGAGTTELSLLSGVYVNTNAISNGPGSQLGTYIGTVRSNSTSTIDMNYGSAASGGGQACLCVWNAYNRIFTKAKVVDTTTSWSYSSATIGSLNNSANNSINFISGLQEEINDGSVEVRVQSAGGFSFGYVGLGLDSNTTMQRKGITLTVGGTTVVGSGVNVRETYDPQLGYHTLYGNQQGDGSTTTTYVGNTEEALMLVTRM